MTPSDRPGLLSSARPALLSRLLAGESADIPTISTTFKSAIAAALATPDLFLIDGLDPAERLHVAETLAMQAAQHGDRVLLMGPSDAQFHLACTGPDRCAACHGPASPPGLWRRLRAWWNRLVHPGSAAPCRNAAKVACATFDSPGKGQFDRLIVAEAHRADGDVLATAAERAGRWILIGNREQISAFGQLWRQLQSRSWVYENGRLVCRLRLLTAAQRAALEVEPVADRPDIELRILPDDGGVPQLAEVVFPGDFGIAEAKSYVLQQLGDVPLCGPLSGGNWSESADGFTFGLAPGTNGAEVAVPLWNGVCEYVGADDGGWTTRSLLFARSAGWTRESAQSWASQQASRCDWGRTARLDRAELIPCGGYR